MDMNAAAIFARVVEAGGFSAAARLLAMPKTTVSKKVSDLEIELGVRLLNRTTRRLSLTEAGARAHAPIVAALLLMEQAERDSRAVLHELSGPLTVAAPGGIGVPFLLPLIMAFMDQHPGLDLTHLSIDTPIDLGTGRIDLMIWPGPIVGDAHAVPIANVEMALYASARYLDLHGAPRTPQDLARHAVVAFTQSIGRQFVWQLSGTSGPVTIRPEAAIRFRSNDPAAILASIDAGQGIGALPPRFVAHMPANGAIVRVLPDWQMPALTLYALDRDGSAASLAAKRFKSFVSEWFASN